jgi:hypothetical protein
MRSSRCMGLGGIPPGVVMSTYKVTVQFRDGNTTERKWTSAEDSADAIFLTLTHLTEAECAKVERVLVTEEQA